MQDRTPQTRKPPKLNSARPSIQAARKTSVAYANNPLNIIFKKISDAVMWLWQKSRVVTVLLFVFLALFCYFSLDYAFTAGKILKGVHVGVVDVSNMTINDAARAISRTYEPRMAATTVYIFADEETAQSQSLDLKILESDSLAEQLSFEEAQKNKKLWITSAKDLEASLPSEELAAKAYEIGRGAGFFERLMTSAKGSTLEPYATFNEMPLSNLLADINTTIGHEVKDFGIKIASNKAVVTEGNDGFMLNSSDFSNTLSEHLLRDDNPVVGFVAKLEYAPLRITKEDAEKTCNAINTLMPETARFSSDKSSVDVWRNTMMGWVKAEAKEREDGGFFLNPFIDQNKGSGDLLNHLEKNMGQHENVKVEYIIEGKDVYVKPEKAISIPKLDEAIGSLDSQIFDSYRSSYTADTAAVVQPINVEYFDSSDRLALSNAVSYGVVDAFSSFTTKYTNTNATAGRTYNIHHAADILNNSIAKSGGNWSFNDVVGPTDEEQGFKEAKIIESGEYTTGIGGGICQVATTVFNAAYEAGLPVKQRRNHSLHSSSYPAGRDSAIAYPTTDLVWTNNTNADILVRSSYTDTSLTVTLIGTNPNKIVETTTGDWVEGRKFTYKYEVDPKLKPNASYVKTAGTNGMDILVTRVVKNQSGEVVFTDNFRSAYAPINMVIAYGEGSDMTAIRQKYEEGISSDTNKHSEEKKPTSPSRSSSSSAASSSNSSSSSSSSQSSSSSASSASRAA